ncbi:tandem-95 repeat protein [Shewanella cyperi]|uniref:Tandem-95 repeat protein n=1 Tax=Shewanella cyperi TaxID=2814292 RepID=A0A974XKQ2_9GAMM|nr:Ig-like domain-containing protein [Shewanella cyperi]QSX30230.1 tandem-95 repeat protein [Shewanella cyperi]
MKNDLKKAALGALVPALFAGAAAAHNSAARSRFSTSRFSSKVAFGKNGAAALKDEAKGKDPFNAFDLAATRDCDTSPAVRMQSQCVSDETRFAVLQDPALIGPGELVKSDMSGDIPDQAQQQPVSQVNKTPPRMAVDEIIIVDAGVEDAAILLNGVDPRIMVFTIAADSDGVKALATILGHFKELQKVHLISHGSDGVLQLGNTRLTREKFDEYAGSLAEIKQAFAEHGGLYLYGCSLAADAKGEAFVTELKNQLGEVNIAASTDLTGPTRLGGDWELELVTGDMDLRSPFDPLAMQQMDHNLATVCYTYAHGTFGTKYIYHPDFGAASSRKRVGLVSSGGSAALYINHIPSDHLVSRNNASNGGTLFASKAAALASPYCQSAVNNAPTVSGAPASVTVLEDTASNVDLSAVIFADADGDSLTVTLSLNAGTLTATSGGGVTIGGSGTDALTLAGTAANINTYLDTASNIKYTGAANATGNGAATLTISATDGNGGNLASNPSVSINITSVNDAPSLSIGSNQSAGSGTGGVQQSVNSFASMSNDGDAEAVQGIADFIVSEASDTNNVVSGVDISNAGTLTYTPASGVEGTATINVQVQDDGGTANSGVDTSSTSQFTITVDTLAPTVTSVSVPASATYIVGQNLNFIVNTSEAVTVNTSGGTPQLGITVGATLRQATYQSGSGTSALLFRYTVQSGDLDSDGIAVGTLSANGGTLRDAALNDMNVTLNSVGSTTNVLVDAIVPTVSSVTLPANGTYVAGQNLDFTVNTSENVTVNTGGGTPQMAITIGATTRQAVYVSGSGTSALVFRYTVQSGDADSDGIAVGTLAANGGTLKDSVGNDMNLTLNSVGSTTSVLVDALAPTVSSVSVPANGTYIAGQNLDFTLNTSEAVTVNTGGGTPQIAITIGATTRQAVYVSGSGTSALLFRYTVQSGELDTDGIAVGALSANGGTLRDAAANDLNTTLNSVGATTSVLVDAVAPTVSSVSVPANATYIAGQNLDFTINMDDNVTVNTGGGTPQIAITIGATTRQATYLAGSGSSALVFRYTVQSGDLDTDGIVVGSLSANGGTLRDAATNDLNTTLNSVGSTASVLVDAVAPTVSSVSVPANGTYIAGQNLDFTVNTSENVTVNTGGGTPQMAITIGATTRQAVYVSGSGTSALLFRYTVQSGDEDINGIAVGTLAANGGTLKDSVGNDMNLTLNSVGSTTSVLVDAVVPTVAISSTSSGTVNGQFDVTFTLSESSTDFDVSDVTVGNGTKGALSGSGTSYTLPLTPSADGTVTVDVAGGVFTDAAGNNNTAATQFSINADVTPPGVTISSSASGTVNGQFDVTFTLSESSTDFEASDITVSNGAKGTLSGSGTSYTLPVTPSADGTVTVDVAGGVFTDAAGNNNTAATQFSIAADVTGPSVVIGSSASGTVNGPFDVTFTLSESSSDFTATDITVSNGTKGTLSGSGSSYTLAVTPSADGTVTVDVAGGVFTDAVGNGNNAATQFSIAADVTSPSINISSTSSGTVNGQFDVTFTLSESSSDFTAADVTVGNGSKGSFSGSGTSYTLVVTPSADGSVTVDVAGGVFTDAAGNGNMAATQFSINADVSAPTLSSSSPFDDEVNVATTVTPVLTFNETVQLGNGSISLQEVGGSSFESFDAGTGMGDNGGSVAVLGSALTITPGAALRTGKQYAIHIDNGAITDSNGNAYAGISDDTTLNFLVRPKLVLSVDKTEVSEPHSETATVTLSLQDDGGNAFVALSDVDVVLALSGTATLNSDYGLLGSNFTEGTLTLTVPAGSDSSTLSVTAIDDVVSDDGETIAVDIDSVSSGNATEVTAQSVSITVNENRTPTLTGLPASFTIVEDEVSNIDLSAVVLADADNDLLNLVLSVDSGTLTSPLGNSGNVTVVGSGTDAMVLTGLAADLNTFLDNANAVAITTAQDQTVDIVLSAAPSDGLANGSMSQATVSVTPVNDAPTGSVTISGMAVEDAMLTASNTLADVEGLGTISYQWNRNGVPVLGATAASYVLGDVDVGGLMTVTASYTDGQGTAESVTSAATAAVANVNDAPTGTVSISGVALEGETLTASHNLADDDGLGAVSFQWLRENAVIANASGSSYLLVAADIGSRISVRAGYTDGHGTAEAVDSAQTEAVVAANKAPVANNSQVSVDEDSSIAIELDATDPDQDTLAVTIETQPTNGELVQQGALWLYTPNADFNGDDSFSYSVSDGSLSSGTATVSITVTPVNDAPVAVADAFELSSDSGQFSAFNVLANDTDIDGDALTLYQVSTNLGEAKVVDNQLSYRAPLGYQGSVVVNYKVRDAAKAESSAVATLTVSSTAAGIVLTPPADVTVNATGLFTKVEMGTAVATAGGESLPVTVDSNGFFSPGAHKVTWSAADGDTTVSMTQAVNVIPLVGLSKDQTASEGSDVSFRVLLNGDAVSYPVEVPYSVGGTAATDGSDHDLVDGSVMFNQGELEKTVSLHLVDDGTPEGNETVVVTLGTPTHAVLGPKASHTLTIVESNVAPSVVLGATQGDGQTRIVSQDGGLVTVTATVTDPNTGDSHSFDWSQSDNALVDSDGDDSTFTFDPSTLSPGFYKLRVAVSDGDKTGMDRLKLRVEAALPTLDTTDSDGDGINDNDEGAGDKDGDGIPDYLDAVNLARNVVQETPASSNSFLMETEPGLALSLGDVAFRANGSDTGVSNGDVVTHGNEGAGATDDIDYRYGNGMFDFNVEELPLSGQSVNIVVAQFQPVPANAVYRKLMPGGWQDFVIDANNAVASASGAEGYCPPPGDAAYSTGLTEGHWCVQLTIEDGGPNDADGEVNSAIDDPGGLAVPAGSNNAPMTTADVVTMKRNASIDIDVLANDTDVDGDSLMLTSVNADLGQVSIVDNQLHYVAEAGHLGEAHLSYGVSDGKGGSASGKVTVSVLPNKAPVAAPDMASVHSGNSVVIDVLANDSDPDADALTVTAASALHGTVVINADNSLTYTPTVGYDGSDTVSYSISDGDGGEAQGTVTIAVSAMETVTITNRSSGGALNFWALGMLLAGLWRRQSKNNKQGVKTK